VPLSDASAIFLAADRAGLDPAAVLAATEEQEVKDALRANTERALGSGVSGVPTVVVGGETFWGDAELEAARG
jgi:2-hydroxychromene-2-carboxylate isomerase